jgi:hypothetical protein
MFFAPPIIEKHVRFFSVTLALSVLFALIGAYNPWPPAREQERDRSAASFVTNPVAGNATAWMQEYFPDAGITSRMKALFISPSKITAARYLTLFYMDKGDYVMADRMRGHPDDNRRGSGR